MADAGVRPHDEAAMMETAHQEDRQRDVGRAACARDHIGRRRHLADVELDVANHAAERLDDRYHLDEIGVDALDRDAAVLDRAGMAVAADGDLQPRPVGPVRNLAIQSLQVHVNTSSHCLGMPVLSMTARHFSMSRFIRWLICSGGPNIGSMPSAATLSLTSGSLCTASISLFSLRTISGGTPEGAESAFQLVTT